ncbi:type 1 fimbrial protein [Pseudomonas sp. P7759]|uniref:fimbrial protein n=1 Tax=Pseudomonas sp. P7759 TaxID=2738831 RepID=UPI0015A243BB|nr:type 1 fimbrial protein [Pseudomonas sp. P7759]NWC77453.1 type 1 fimbrial protein [Pseudomonas sp. P7759]
MLRYLVILNLFVFLLFSGVARADYGHNPCTLGPVTSTFNVTSDPALANIGDLIGVYTIEGSVVECGPAITVSTVAYFMGQQAVDPLSPGNNYRCQTTVSGVAYEAARPVGENSCDAESVAGAERFRRGPLIARVPLTPFVFPKNFSVSYNIVKTGNIPAGPNVLGPLNLSIIAAGVNGGLATFLDQNAGTLTPGEIIGTTCSLATTLVPVDFGDATIGDTESFAISFNSCTDQQDAVAYNNAVSLEFSSGQTIQSDGSALLNCVGTDCAKGLQIELQDGNGSPINLMAPYKLSTNNPVIGANGLDYTFNAQLQANPAEPLGGGKIDTQLVFNTIIE